MRWWRRVFGAGAQRSLEKPRALVSDRRLLRRRFQDFAKFLALGSSTSLLKRRDLALLATRPTGPTSVRASRKPARSMALHLDVQVSRSASTTRSTPRFRDSGNCAMPSPASTTAATDVGFLRSKAGASRAAVARRSRGWRPAWAASIWVIFSPITLHTKSGSTHLRPSPPFRSSSSPNEPTLSLSET